MALLGVFGSYNPRPHCPYSLHRSTSGSTLGPPTPLPPISPSPTPTPEPVEEDAAKRAEKIKDQGNAAFKAANYAEAVDFYTKAIGSYPFLL